MNKRFIIFSFIFLLQATLQFALGQSSNLNTDAKTITYEELYDNPYDISKLFIHIQPIYGEFFSTNSTAGFGLEAQYYHENLFDVKASARIPYYRRTDLVRDAAFKNATTDNEPRSYNYFEMVGTYHVVDREEDSETKFILFSNRYKGDKWAATVPLHTVIPTKMRRIYGVRVGGFSYATAISYENLLKDQGVELISDEGQPMDDAASVYGDMTVQGAYLGASMTIIKNVAVQPDKIYGTLVNDLIFNTYFDIMFAPSINIQHIFLNEIRYASDPVEQNMFGFRLGIDGKFNRDVGWGYNIELGHRPGLQKSGFYVLGKISFPVFSTQLRHQVESFGK